MQARAKEKGTERAGQGREMRTEVAKWFRSRALHEQGKVEVAWAFLLPDQQEYWCREADGLLCLLHIKIETIENPYPNGEDHVPQREAFEVAREEILGLLEEAQ